MPPHGHPAEVLAKVASSERHSAPFPSLQKLHDRTDSSKVRRNMRDNDALRHFQAEASGNTDKTENGTKARERDAKVRQREAQVIGISFANISVL